MIDTDTAEQILRGDDTHPDILQATGLELLAEVERLRYIVDSIPDEVWKDMKTWEAMEGVIE